MTQFDSMNHTLAFQFPSHREFSLVCFVDRGSGSRLEDHHANVDLVIPLTSAIISRCPQCRAVTKISLVEPDLEPLKERHTFACEQCRSSCIYLI
jgi:hypothetical protein